MEETEGGLGLDAEVKGQSCLNMKRRTECFFNTMTLALEES